MNFINQLIRKLLKYSLFQVAIDSSHTKKKSFFKSNLKGNRDALDADADLAGTDLEGLLYPENDKDDITGFSGKTLPKQGFK